MDQSAVCSRNPRRFPFESIFLIKILTDYTIKGFNSQEFISIIFNIFVNILVFGVIPICLCPVLSKNTQKTAVRSDHDGCYSTVVIPYSDILYSTHFQQNNNCNSLHYNKALYISHELPGFQSSLYPRSGVSVKTISLLSLPSVSNTIISFVPSFSIGAGQYSVF